MSHPDEAEVVIAAGSFVMGRPFSDLFTAPEEQPEREVELSAFAIDVHPVTNRRYREFVAAGGYRERRLWSEEGWAWRERTGVAVPHGWSRPGFGRDELPVVGVSWHEARAFCAFAGRRLPTSAEWERAARGRDRRPFPWGDALPRADLCNFAGRRGGPTPIGSYPAGVSPEGLHDMAGNVNNWVEDVFWMGFGAWCVRERRLRDPVLTEELARTIGVEEPLRRTDRGGGWLTAFEYHEVLGTTRPLGWLPIARELWHGFRTARGAEGA